MMLDQPRALDLKDQHTIATWGTKTVLTIQAVNFNEYRVADDDVYRWFYEHTMPLPDSQAWIGRYGGTEESAARWPVTYHQGSFYLATEGEREAPPADGQPTGYTVAMGIGSFAFLLWGHTVKGGPRPEGVSDSKRLLIWPSIRPVHWPPPETLADDDALQAALQEFPAGVQLMNALPQHPEHRASPGT
jgi:hypothetical protein